MKITAFSIAALCALIGCSDSQAPSPSLDGKSQDRGGLVDTVFEVKAARGATLRIPGGITLSIAPGALDKDTTITVSVPKGQDRTREIIKLRLQPEGLTFKTPATLTIPYDDGGASAWSTTAKSNSASLTV